MFVTAALISLSANKGVSTSSSKCRSIAAKLKVAHKGFAANLASNTKIISRSLCLGASNYVYGYHL